MLGFWPFTAMKICPMAYKIYPNRLKILPNTKWTLSKCPKNLTVCQSGEISPNLVTLVTTHSNEFFLSWQMQNGKEKMCLFHEIFKTSKRRNEMKWKRYFYEWHFVHFHTQTCSGSSGASQMQQRSRLATLNCKLVYVKDCLLQVLKGVGFHSF